MIVKKNIEDCKNCLKTGNITKVYELINTKNEMFLINDPRFVDDISILVGCCNQAVDFCSLAEKEIWIDAFNYYISSKYLKSNNYLNDVFIECVNEIVKNLPSKIESLEKNREWKEIITMINNKKDNLNDYKIKSKYENAKSKYISKICDKIDKYKEENDGPHDETDVYKALLHNKIVPKIIK